MIKNIMAEKKRKIEKRLKKKYKMKWRGYIRTTWESIKNLEETEALD